MGFASGVQFGQEKKGSKIMNGVKAFVSSIGVTSVYMFTNACKYITRLLWACWLFTAGV